MRAQFDRALAGAKRKAAASTTSQKVTAAVGAGGLLLGGVLVFQWATTPTFAPLFASMSSSDSAAVIEELNAQGVPHELSSDGSTVLVPQEQVHETRIALSGAGLPADDTGGYSLLDNQSLSTSQFQEQTSFKRAMEGELATTIEAIDGVRTAVVHLALPAKQVFAREQDPATASVLVDVDRGATFGPDQVQTVIHLVASSIDGLTPEKVTVADASGRVLSDDASGTGSGSRNRVLAEYQDQVNAKIQAMLDTVVGPGNSTVAVTADLDFDQARSTSTSYESDPERDPIARSEQTETYRGTDRGGVGGVVGPDGNTELPDGNDGNGTYRKRSVTEDNAVNSVVEQRESAPGSVNSLHIGVAIDEGVDARVSVADMRDLISAAIGENLDRGDTVEVTRLPFDRTAAEEAEAAFAAAEQEERDAARAQMWQTIAIVALIVAVLAAIWVVSRRRARARKEATETIVEQLRLENESRVQPISEEATPAVSLLEAAERDEVEKMRDELAALVERQPEDVAALLRGWLVEAPR